ncbi:MAG: hypothetical protein A2Y80_10585 [Deltaproteobacteria bacterium RBG_13_58_19]|nr:MAG: hypothetical protein A2Y80_10585 [Deltaproteobacteria bacterium RBG_13_58_19]
MGICGGRARNLRSLPYPHTPLPTLFMGLRKAGVNVPPSPAYYNPHKGLGEGVRAHRPLAHSPK